MAASVVVFLIFQNNRTDAAVVTWCRNMCKDAEQQKASRWEEASWRKINERMSRAPRGKLPLFSVCVFLRALFSLTSRRNLHGRVATSARDLAEPAVGCYELNVPHIRRKKTNVLNYFGVNK